MQPYILPYLGYFQLIHHVDLFILLDDVQWINRGWINRNRILVGGEPQYFTFPVSKPSSRSNICDVRMSQEFALRLSKLIKTVSRAYASAPHIDTVINALQGLNDSPDEHIVDLVERSLKTECGHLNITTPIIRSSSLALPTELKAAERIIKIVKTVGGSGYVNMIGGKEMYATSVFATEGIDLEFLQPELLPYSQTGQEEFTPGLSILDAMAHTGRDELRSLATAGQTITAQG